ncbi:MAG TPA: tripartite tricarboxylate transporter TctB family protein [Methylomirabilota bacterium]|nr:tripartite tricarboxylate transporter TctB family protein [Methylomirabilota bacterium]
MLTTDRVAGGALALLGVLVIVESRSLPLGSLRNPGPAFMPVALALVLLAFGVLIAGLGAGAPGVAAVGWAEARHAVVILAVCAFTTLALERLGYRLTMLLALFVLVKLVERRGLMASVVFSAGMAFGSYFLFDTLLRVPLPRGPLGI